MEVVKKQSIGRYTLPIKRGYEAAARWVGVRTWVKGLLAGAIFFGFLSIVQFSTPNMPGNDGFYHIKMAYLMRTEGIKPPFPWLPLTILNPREFYNHHFLFHVALMPFTLGDLRLGAKWASVLFAALAFFGVWRLLDKQRIPYAWLWSLGLLALSEAFIFRMSVARAQSLSLLVLVTGLHWLLTRKYWRVFFLGFLYVWFYNAFPLLFIIAGIYTVSVWLVERRIDLRPLGFSGAGIAAGLVINPYFPYNILFAYQHIAPKLLNATSVSVGNEWFPYTTGQLLQNSPLAFAVFLLGVLGLGLAGRRMDLRTAVSFFLVSMFGLMLFQSRRFIEYFPPFALIFAAFAWAPILKEWGSRHSLDGASRRKINSIRGTAPVLAAAVLLVGAVWWNGSASLSTMQGLKPHTLYQGVSGWLEDSTPAGERVFQTDWDDFPRLFFYNTHNTYLVGLDPTYMQLYDQSLYELWVDITRGRIETPARSILVDFGARYVLSDLEHESFLKQAKGDPELVEVYRDEEAVVFLVAIEGW
jgi:hypothetical protein